MSLIRIWELVNNKYGAIVAGIVVVVIVGFAWWFGYTPYQVAGWLAK